MSGRATDRLADYIALQSKKDVMIARGWCSHQANYLSKIYDIETFSYLAQLEISPQRQVDHTPCNDQDACIAYNVDETTYIARHTTEGCTCPMICTPYDKLVKTIKSGHIPLVSIEGTDDFPEIKIKPRGRKSSYLALSHIWADGLRNPTSNGLPRCQINQLKVHIQEYCWPKQPLVRKNGKNSLYVWMGTLCIPVNRDDKDLRLEQIYRMASIYAGSDCGLVLDAELMNIILTLSALPGRARIACSVWMCRSWTLQEGALPSKITVQFQNGILLITSKLDILPKQTGEPIPLEAVDQLIVSRDLERQQPCITDEAHHTTYASKHSRIAKALDKNSRHTFFGRLERPTVVEEFVSVWNILAGRSTTKPKDTPIILSNVLKMYNRPLSACADSWEMMEKIFFSLKSIPISLFFNPESCRQHGQKRRNPWIPNSIGRDFLTTSGMLKRRRSHLLYKHRVHDKMIEIFTYEGTLPCSAPYNVRKKSRPQSSFASRDLRKDTVIYVVVPVTVHNGPVNVRALLGTCLILENLPLRRGADPREERGACFYYTRKSKSYLDTHGSEMELEFQWPIKLRKCGEDESARACRIGPVYDVFAVSDPCNYKIRHDPVENFQLLRRRVPLRRRAWRRVAEFVGMSLTAYPFLTIFAVSVFTFIHTPIALFLLVGIAVAGGVAATILLYVTVRGQRWRYVPSFEWVSTRNHRRQDVEVQG